MLAVDPVTSSPLPREADVVIVGGGIIGTCTAFWLARAGVKVALCEKGIVAGEQSSRNWGWCRAMGRDPRELQLAIEAVRLWRDMDTLVEGETGFRQTGILYLCDTEQAMEKHRAWLPHAKEHQLDSRLVSAAEVAQLLPGNSRKWAGGLHTPSDGIAEPQKAAPAVARAVQRLGGAVVTNCAVRGIETAAGRISGVVTEKGTIACKSVVLAGGAWSRVFARSLGIALPQLKVLASVSRTAPKPGPQVAAWGPGIAFRPRADGGYNISSGTVVADIVPDSFRWFREFLPALGMTWGGMSLRLGGRFLKEASLPARWALDAASPFERERILDPVPDPKAIEAAKRDFEALFPALAPVETIESWGGMIDVTPDVLPVMSEVDALPGFFIATGFSGHGFGIGPAAGRFMAELVTGRPTSVDPRPFRFARFADGSDLKPQAGL